MPIRADLSPLRNCKATRLRAAARKLDTVRRLPGRSGPSAPHLLCRRSQFELGIPGAAKVRHESTLRWLDGCRRTLLRGPTPGAIEVTTRPRQLPAKAWCAWVKLVPVRPTRPPRLVRVACTPLPQLACANTRLVEILATAKNPSQRRRLLCWSAPKQRRRWIPFKF